MEKQEFHLINSQWHINIPLTYFMYLNPPTLHDN